MNLLEEKAKERQFAEDAKRRLIRDSFLKNDTSGEHIEHLVKLLEDYEPADKQAMEEGKQKFEEFVKKNYAKEARKSRLKKVGKCLSAVAMVALIIILSVNVVTQATMHKNIFDFVLNRDSILEYQYNNQQVDMAFASIAEVEQYLNEKLVLPTNTMSVKVDEIHLNQVSETEYHLYLHYINEDDKYLTFNIRLLNNTNEYIDNFKLSDDDWKEIELADLKLSNITIAIKGNDYKLYTYINKSSYEISSDLPVEELIEILNSIPLP